MKTFLIQSYGIFDKDLRAQTELQGLNEYYTQVCNYVLQHKPEIVVLMGGYTDSEIDISEAESSFYNFIETYFELFNLDDDYQPQVLLQNSGHTSGQNLALSLFTLQKFLPQISSVEVICDQVRTSKTQALAEIVFAGKLDFKIVGFSRIDIHPNSTLEKQAELTPQETTDPTFVKLAEAARLLFKN